MSNTLLSFCIPTYNRIEILRNTLNSIYQQATPDLMPHFEVVVSDNSKDHSCQSLVEEFGMFKNFHYKMTKCEGFMNSYYSLSYGNGTYLKLHNNTYALKPGALKHMVELIKNNIVNEPFIFFTDGYRLKGKVIKCESFDDYMKELSYFSSWSGGFGIWKADFEKVRDVQIEPYFPQTSLILTQYYKDKFIMDDYDIFSPQTVPGKGGYNIFKVFSINYINLIKRSRDEGYITSETYDHIRRAMLFKFLAVRYFKTVIARMDNFEHTGIKEGILRNYSLAEYYIFLLESIIGPFRFIIREQYRKHFTNLKQQEQ